MFEGERYPFKRLSGTNKHDEFYVDNIECAVKWVWVIKRQESQRSQSTVSPARY